MNRFKETTNALVQQLTGFPTLGEAIQTGRVKIVHDTYRCLTVVALLRPRGPARIALVGGDRGRTPNQPRHLFVRIGLGRLACPRPQRFVERLSLRGLELANMTEALRNDFDSIRTGEVVYPLTGESEFDSAPLKPKKAATKRRAAVKKKKTTTAKRRAA